MPKYRTIRKPIFVASPEERFAIDPTLLAENQIVVESGVSAYVLVDKASSTGDMGYCFLGYVAGYTPPTGEPPAPETGDFVLNLDANTLSLSSGDAVSTWYDQSSNHNDVTHSEEGRHPTFVTLYGRNGVRFNGESHTLERASNSTLQLTESTIFAVTKYHSQGARSWLIGKAGEYAFGKLETEKNAFGCSRLWVESNKGDENIDNQIYLVSCRTDSTKTDIYLNGTLDVSHNLDSGTNTTGNSNFVIGHYNSAEYFKGIVHEILIFNRALTDAEMSSIHTMLYNKWDVGNTVPAEAYPPAKPNAPSLESISINDGTTINILTNIPALPNGATAINAMYSADGGATWGAYCNNVTPSSQYQLSSVGDIWPSIDIRIDAVNEAGTTSSDVVNIPKPHFRIKSTATFPNLNGGLGYAQNDVLTATGGTGTAFTVTADVDESDGHCTNYNFTTAGDYTVRPEDPIHTSGGMGDGNASFACWSYSVENWEIFTPE